MGSKWNKALGALAVVEIAAESRVLNNKLEKEIEEAYEVERPAVNSRTRQWQQTHSTHI